MQLFAIGFKLNQLLQSSTRKMPYVVFGFETAKASRNGKHGGKIAAEA